MGDNVEMSTVAREKNHHYILGLSILTLVGMMVIIGGSVWWWNSSSEESDIKEKKATSEITKIEKFKKVIANLDTDKFWEIKKKNDLAVPESPIVTQGIKVFSKVIEDNLGKGAQYTYSLKNPNKEDAGLISNGIDIVVFPTFTQLAKILEAVEQNNRLYFISEITTTRASGGEIEDPNLNVLIKASMFSEKK